MGVIDGVAKWVLKCSGYVKCSVTDHHKSKSNPFAVALDSILNLYMKGLHSEYADESLSR